MQVETGHQCSSGLLNDYSDGKAFMNHPLFSVNSKALQVFLYFDEVEVCNPLGSKAKIHKLGTYMCDDKPLCVHMFAVCVWVCYVCMHVGARVHI